MVDEEKQKQKKAEVKDLGLGVAGLAGFEEAFRSRLEGRALRAKEALTSTPWRRA